MAKIVYLMRHVAPLAPARGRYWGKADPGVDPESLALVPDLADSMRPPPARLFSSPLVRAAATAKALAAPLGLVPEIGDDLAEIDFGRFDGMTFAEIAEACPGEAEEWARLGDAFAFPGGEAVQAFFARAANAWRRCVDSADDVVAVVSHGGVLAVWNCLFLELPFELRFRFRPDCAALTAFARNRDDNGWELAFFNNRK